MYLSVILPKPSERTLRGAQSALMAFLRSALFYLLVLPSGAIAFDLEAAESAISAHYKNESPQPLVFYLPLAPISDDELNRLSKGDADSIYGDVYGGTGIWGLSTEQGAVFAPRARLNSPDSTRRATGALNSLVFIQSCGHQKADASMSGPPLSKAIQDAFQIRDDQIDMKSCGPGVIVIGPLPDPEAGDDQESEVTTRSVKRLESNLLERGFKLGKSSSAKMLVPRNVEVSDQSLFDAVQLVGSSTTANCGTKGACGPGVTPVGPLPLPKDIFNNSDIRVLPSEVNSELFK